MKGEERLDPSDITSLDDLAVTVRRDLDLRPPPALIAYSLRRAQRELSKIGLQIVLRPRHHRIRSAPVAVALTTDDDDPVKPAMDLHVVQEAIRLKLITEHDAPRFLGGVTLQQAITAKLTKLEHLNAAGEWDPPPPPFFTRRQPPGDEPTP